MPKRLSPVKLKAIHMANANIKTFSKNELLGVSNTETLKALITRKKVVAAVWRDNLEPDLCGIRFIKGCEQDFSRLSDDEVAAIHCNCIEEAIAMERVFVDPDRRDIAVLQ